MSNPDMASAVTAAGAAKAKDGDHKSFYNRFVLPPVDKASGVFGALWLIGWFVVCLFGILCTMAAQDFQKRLVGATDNTKYSVGYALDQVDELKHRREYWQDRTKALSTAEGTEGKTAADFQNALASATSHRAQLDGVFGGMRSVLPPNISSPPLGDGMKADDVLQSLQLARKEYQQFVTAFGALPAHAPQLDNLNAASGALELFAASVEGMQTASSAWGAAQNAVTTRQNEVKGALANLSAPPFDNRDFEQLSDDLSRYTKFLGGGPFEFVKIPSIALTLLLTVLMGILGSLIAMTRSLVFENAEITIGEYLFRIGLGASVALAVFFFAGVGVLTLAQSSASDHGVEPSPYLVSFFGIIAGYLSRRVTLWMREAGGRSFPVREEADRWAIDLQAALVAASVDAAGLATTTGLDDTKIGAWIARKETIPRSAQALISAYVRQPAYKLFTDIDPAKGSI